MAVPDYQSLMLPVLYAVVDGKEHTSTEINEKVARDISLSDADRSALLPSGKTKLFNSRMGWARQYLLWARLLQKPQRGVYQLTERGTEALSQTGGITLKYLEQYPEFREVEQRSRSGRATVQAASPAEREMSQDPREAIEIGYSQLRVQLAQDLLEQVMACSPEFFERLVVDLLVAMGYGGSQEDAAKAVGGSGDGGIDGVIKEDRLGLDVVYVQAKRWQGSVGRPIVQGFAGSLDGQRASKGVLITTGQITPDARDFVSRIQKKIVLIDGSELAELMIDYGIGATEVTRYSIKRLDTDYFESEAIQ